MSTVFARRLRWQRWALQTSGGMNFFAGINDGGRLVGHVVPGKQLRF